MFAWSPRVMLSAPGMNLIEHCLFHVAVVSGRQATPFIPVDLSSSRLSRSDLTSPGCVLPLGTRPLSNLEVTEGISRTQPQMTFVATDCLRLPKSLDRMEAVITERDWVPCGDGSIHHGCLRFMRPKQKRVYLNLIINDCSGHAFISVNRYHRC